MSYAPRRLTMALAAGAIALAACSNDPTWEDARTSLVDGGFSRETAECVVDAVQADGFEPSDLTGDTLSAELETSLERAVTGCVRGSDVEGLLGAEQVRAQFIEGISASGDVSVETAECMYDELLDAGFGPGDFLDVEGSGLLDASRQALAACE